jgi:hypothetical protein
MLARAKLVQLRNAPLPIRITEPGISMDVKPVLANAPLPIDVTVAGMLIEVIPMQS